MAAGEEVKHCFAIGWASGREEALKTIAALRERPSALAEAEAAWQERLRALRVETGDEALDRLLPWLVKQALDARVRARAGLYQAGGAYGFRDQLQDMLALMHFEPALAREHLLFCAARQFAAGDVLHWWHMPCSGVRTRISDDRLFLPYAAAAYVRLTGDAGVLGERVPYLRDVPIPEGKADWYGPAEVSEEMGTLHDHCMRAFRLSASLTGEHGLALMGAGDWNDSMDRVGARGKGESVWLSQFLSVAAQRYAEVAPDENDRAWLNALSAQMGGNGKVLEFARAPYGGSHHCDGSGRSFFLQRKKRPVFKIPVDHLFGGVRFEQQFQIFLFPAFRAAYDLHIIRVMRTGRLAPLSPHLCGRYFS